MTRVLGLIILGTFLLYGCSNDDLAEIDSPVLTGHRECTVTYTHFEVYTDDDYAQVQEDIISYLNDNASKIIAGPTVTDAGVEVTGNCRFLQQQVLADVRHRFGYRMSIPE